LVHALEDLFEAFARAFEESPAKGERWHLELLQRMSTRLPYARPPVVAPALLPSLRVVLGFRHYLRHAYAVRLDGAKLVTALRAVLRTHG
jgi:hypothetical protein